MADEKAESSEAKSEPVPTGLSICKSEAEAVF